ncbi:MAG: hypothetical protein E6K17_09865 [Methanobacteriota archaeon]|nr:MAG: hypothetical protein E6K17_09865 [Euryarchaeota archaeon]
MDSGQGGPGSMTLAERFITAFRLPYPLGCVLVGVVLFGIVDALLQGYSTTSNVGSTIGYAVAPQNVMVYLLVAYSFYASRYMRGTLEQVRLAPFLPDREAGYTKIFGSVSATRPQVLTWALFLVALLLATNASALSGSGSGTFVFNAGPGSALEFVSGIFSLVSYAVATLGLSSVVWTYSTISRGIHRFGGAPSRSAPITRMLSSG